MVQGARLQPRGDFSSQITLAKYRREQIIGRVKKLLHGRQRKRIRVAMSDRIRGTSSLIWPSPQTWQRELCWAQMATDSTRTVVLDKGTPPSTLIFIAVLDIFLTLLEDSDTGKSHAYADDLVHLAPSLETQQHQADSVCGFCAITGLEILVTKVEAVSLNYLGILHDTPS